MYRIYGNAETLEDILKAAPKDRREKFYEYNDIKSFRKFYGKDAVRELKRQLDWKK